MARLTALLHKLQTPSKRMIGRVSVLNTLLRTAAGDGDDGESGDEEILSLSGTVDKRNEVADEDDTNMPLPLPLPLRLGDDDNVIVVVGNA